MRKKRMPALLLCLLLMVGCAQTMPATETDHTQLQVVCTTFPLYDWARQILGDTDHVTLQLLVDNGTDMHSYQPSTTDLAAISSCDVLLYIGGTSDLWVDDALKTATNPEKATIRLTEVLKDTIRTEEITEGMEAEDTGEDEEYDEHVWLSLRNAETCCQAIADTLGQADTEYAAYYQENAAAYIARLDQADQDFEATVQQAKRNVLLFADRFPFRYLTEDYGLTYYAAFPGCSSETEASFETVLFLASQVDAEQLPSVCIIDGSDRSLAAAVIANTQQKNQNIVQLDSMQTITQEEIDAGVSYLSVMEENLAVLSEALN